MIQRFWKKKDPPSPVGETFEHVSTNMVLDEWTPHDEGLVTSAVHTNDIDVLLGHKDYENAKHSPVPAEQTTCITVMSKGESITVPQDDHVTASKDRPIATPFQFFKSDDETFATLRRKPLQVSMMNQITPTPMPEQTNALHLVSNVGHSSVQLKCTTLFPGSCQSKNGNTTTDIGDVSMTLSSTADTKAAIVTPFGLHHSESSCKTDKSVTESKHPQSLSPVNYTNFDCHRSECSDPMLNNDDDDDGEYLDCHQSDRSDPILSDIFSDDASSPMELVNVDHFDTQNDDGVELHHETWSVFDILFFELQNTDSVPEMSMTEVAQWYERHQTAWLANDSTLYLHDALFGGWLVTDPVCDNDNFSVLLWYNWLMPMLTLFLAILLFSGRAMENRFLMDCFDASTKSLILDDPCQGLLAPLMFVGTDFGYVGMVRME